MIDRLDGPAQVDAFLLARDVAALIELVAARDKTIAVLQMELRDVRARRLERLNTLLRDAQGRIIGSASERVEGI